MKVVIRVDASINMGTGHVMRCLTLAHSLRIQKAEVSFICRKHNGNLIEFIRQKEFDVYVLPEATEQLKSGPDQIATKDIASILDHANWLGVSQQLDAEQCEPVLQRIKPDWLIVDHYAIDIVWQELLKSNYSKLLVIDDLADRKHSCDLLLDQTYGRQKNDYKGLIKKTCTFMLGSKYSLLRPEFARLRAYSLERRRKPELKKILVTMGGVDEKNYTGQILQLISDSDLLGNIQLTVVMGSNAPHLSSIQSLVNKMSVSTKLLTDVDNMSEIMAHSDLAIGAAGTTTWERCALGLPSILVIIADNQKMIARNLQKIDAVIVVDKNKIDSVIKIISEITSNRLKTLSENTSEVTDGQGSNHVVRMMGQLS